MPSHGHGTALPKSPRLAPPCPIHSLAPRLPSPQSNVRRMLGYFSLVGLLRVHSILGDYATAIKVGGVGRELRTGAQSMGGGAGAVSLP